MAFSDLVKVLGKLGFQCRIKGSHHIFYRDGISEIVNLQPKGSTSKPYQVKQVRELIVKYRLVVKGETNE
ncbi:type II toxin-antitoxin system HicA family toxin [Limnohabitans sp.]|uniref:type II toxin-antitoxin system HicA family toxin n=1 Tax=Limnohabitans sp. TaxID=1907725 RepID=UPI0038621CB7